MKRTDLGEYVKKTQGSFATSIFSMKEIQLSLKARIYHMRSQGECARIHLSVMRHFFSHTKIFDGPPLLLRAWVFKKGTPFIDLLTGDLQAKGAPDYII